MAASLQTFTGTLQAGDTVNTQAIGDLQNALNDVGRASPIIPITGKYTPATARGVMDWQQAHGLPVTGIADPRTIASIRSQYSGGIGIVPPSRFVGPSPADADPRANVPGVTPAPGAGFLGNLSYGEKLAAAAVVGFITKKLKWW